MGNFSQTVQTISEGARVLLQAGSIVLALLLCFTGFRMVRKWISLIGFIAGAVVGYSAATGAELGKDYWFFPLLIALGVGVIVSALGYKLFKVGLFIFCGAVSAWAAAGHLLPMLQQQNALRIFYLQILLEAVAFVIGGILAVKFSRTAIILVSAIGGARIASANLVQMMPAYFPEREKQLLLFAALAVVGILLQFLTTKKE